VVRSYFIHSLSNVAPLMLPACKSWDSILLHEYRHLRRKETDLYSCPRPSWMNLTIHGFTVALLVRQQGFYYHDRGGPSWVQDELGLKIFVFCAHGADNILYCYQPCLEQFFSLLLYFRRISLGIYKFIWDVGGHPHGSTLLLTFCLDLVIFLL
jgi:hypothetical protein